LYGTRYGTVPYLFDSLLFLMGLTFIFAGESEVNKIDSVVVLPRSQQDVLGLDVVVAIVPAVYEFYRVVE
jgi:hypothetical protein